MADNEGFFIATVKNLKTGLLPTSLEAIFYGNGNPDTSENPLHRLISWEVTDTEKEKDSFSFTLDNFDLALFDSKLFKKGNEVQFQFGTADNMSPRFTGIINKRSGWRILTIGGNFKSEISISERQATQKWTNKRLSDVARELFLAEGLIPQVDDTTAILPVIIRQNETVLQFLKRKKKDIAGAYEVYVENNIGYFVKKKFKNQPIATIKYGTEAAEEDYVTIGEPEYIDEQEATAVEETVKGMDILGKKPLSEKGNNESSEQTSLGKGTYYFDEAAGGFKFRPAGAQKSPETGIGKPTNKQTTESAKDSAQSAFDSKNAKAFKLTWKILGNPKIKAKEVINIQCDSKEVSGNWYSEKVTHTCTGGSYTTDLSLIRNATGQAVGTVPATPKGGTNTNDAEKKEGVSYVFDEKAGKFRPK